MKLQFTQLTGALVALGLAGVANAAALNDAQENNTAQDEPGLSFAAEYLLVQPVSDGLEARGADFIGQIIPGENLQTKLNNSAFRLEGLYKFGDGRDVKIDWTHLIGKNITGNFELTDRPDSAPNDFLSTKGKYKFDAVNLELGQTLYASERTSYRIFGGVQLARIGTDSSVTYNTFTRNNDGDFAPNEPVALESYKSSVFAVGPRLGAQGKVGLIDNFSITGTIAASLLVGDLKHEVTTPTSATETTTVKTTERAIIPALETRVGLLYDLPSFDGNDVSVELGYQAASYSNAIKSNISGTRENFAYQGPYLSVRWAGDIG
ncbi:MAG: Lpg1974 family pore-forming outer membrane protein [Gammaproteobacteria bacterium]